MEENLNKQSKEERIIRRLSWLNIQLGIIGITFIILLLISMLDSWSTFSYDPLSAILLTILQWYLLISLLTAIVLAITSIVFYFSGMKKAAKKVFLKVIILGLIIFVSYYLITFFSCTLCGPVQP